MHEETSKVLGLLEATYVMEGTDDQWLGGVVTAAARLLERGLGLSGYFVDAGEPQEFSAWGLQTSGMDADAERQRFDLWNARAPIELKRCAHVWHPTSFASQLEVDVLPKGALQQSFEVVGHADVLGISAIDATGRGCALAVPCPHRATAAPHHSERTLWERVAAHLATALRLRRRLSESGPSPPEAVFDARGRLEHAEGEAKTAFSRKRLREAARKFDAARIDGRDPPLRATELWRAMVMGRWSLVDQFDRDGRRFIVARRNEPNVTPLAKLSQREAQVVRAAALGHSNKMIAYELGVSPSTVSACLRRAVDKSGAETKLELIRRVARATDDRGRSRR